MWGELVGDISLASRASYGGTRSFAQPCLSLTLELNKPRLKFEKARVKRDVGPVGL